VIAPASDRPATLRRTGEDPFGDEPSESINKKALDAILVGDDTKASAVVHSQTCSIMPTTSRSAGSRRKATAGFPRNEYAFARTGG